MGTKNMLDHTYMKYCNAPHCSRTTNDSNSSGTSSGAFDSFVKCIGKGLLNEQRQAKYSRKTAALIVCAQFP